MAVSVVGFDLGSLSSYVVVARQGGIEAVANEYSDRNTPSFVSFSDQTRFIGHEAKQQQVTNIQNTVYGFTHLLGKAFNDRKVQRELARVPYRVVPTADGRAGIEVSYLGETQVFSPEQVYAMQLTKLKEVAEMNLSTKVVDVVINVPTYATDSERRAILDAAQIANLNCVRILNDTTAVALAYGIYNKDLPEPESAPKNVVFIDFGNSSLQSNVVAFNKGKMRVVASSCCFLGGRDFDQVIYDKVKSEFAANYKLAVSDGTKPAIRLMQECEKLKKLMSANSTEIPLNIECFMNDVDVSARMKRADFEQLSADLLVQVKATLVSLLAEAKLSAADIESVELVGGTTRIPAVKQIVAEVFQKEGRTSLNADEAVARGCALQCAIMSPAFRVKDFSITDTISYPIALVYEENAKENVEIFSKWNSFPASKQMTFMRSGPFKLEGRYSAPDSIPNDNHTIGLFNVTGFQSAKGEPMKIKVKVRLNLNGIFTLSHAQLIESVEKQVEVEVDAAEEPNNKSEPMETDGGNSDAATKEPTPPGAEENGDVSGANKPAPPAANEAGENNKPPKKVKKLVTKTVPKYTDLPMQAMILQYLSQKISEFNEKENQMIMQVKLQKEKASAKNSLEEYVYEMRDKLYGELESFVSEADRDQFSCELTAAENWLYEDGEDVSKQVYIDRLNELRKHGDRIVYRAKEAFERPVAIDEFGKAASNISRFIALIDSADESVSHLTSAERETLARALADKQSWFTQEISRQRDLKPFEDPVVTAAQILAQKQAMEAVAGPIVSKPKPIVTPPAGPDAAPAGAAADPKTEPDSSSGNPNNNSNSNSNGDGCQQNSTENNGSSKIDKPEDMDLD